MKSSRTGRKKRQEPTTAMGHLPTKNQGYQLPLELWMELVEESSRRKRLGLPLPTQNAIAVEAIGDWLSKNKGNMA